MTDTTHLSGPMLDYYAALVEGMPTPLLKRHECDDTYICIIGDPVFSICAYSPATNPALALPIIEKLISNGFCIELMELHTHNDIIIVSKFVELENDKVRYTSGESTSVTEAALRALIAWKFPDGLPDPVYEREEK